MGGKKVKSVSTKLDAKPSDTQRMHRKTPTSRRIAAEALEWSSTGRSSQPNDPEAAARLP
ncbi:MAG: hypothetical protein CMJ74_07770 [Planctomycetaceae bacterium]|nr:hypothetical protein [Planctomycetaceae bacterium]